MKKIKVYQHGDVVLTPVGQEGVPTPDGLEVVSNSPVLALGEISGHAHVLETDRVNWLAQAVEDIPAFQSMGNASGPVFVEIEEAAQLDHLDRQGNLTGEHDSVGIPAGLYQITRPIEFDATQDSRHRPVWD